TSFRSPVLASHLLRPPSVGAGLAGPPTNAAERPRAQATPGRAGLEDLATKAEGDEAESLAPGSHRPRERAERYCGRTWTCGLWGGRCCSMIRMVLITSMARWTWRSFFRSSIGSRDGCRSFCASLGSSTTMSGVMPLPWIERPFDPRQGHHAEIGRAHV